jgi:hypothetical protein
MDEPTVPIPLILSEDYDALRQVWSGEELPAVYQTWMTRHSAVLRGVRESGIATRVVTVKVADFTVRCRRSKRPIDMSALTEYAAGLPH